MNNIDKQYQSLLQDILDNGVEKKDRTGTGTISVFGRQIRHKMSEGFPLLTTKKMPFKTIVTELLWFLRGDTNIKYLVDNNCHIWNGDAYKNYLFNSEWFPISSVGGGFIGTKTDSDEIMTQERFIEKIKTDDEFAKKWGELGPIYGKQWRSWAKFNEKVYTKQVREVPEGGRFAETRNVNWAGGSEVAYIDQIANLINDLKTNPDSRRLMVNAWNVGELDQMVLPPCHYGFQIYTRELSFEERLDWMRGNKSKVILPMRDPNIEFSMDEWFRPYGVPKRAISLMWNQRSVDTFLGLPFNIASYGLLLEIIAKEVNMVPDELIGNLGDVHLYSNHIEPAKEQIGRELSAQERLEWVKVNLLNIDVNGFVNNDEYSHKWVETLSDNIPTRAREPFPLPTLKINPNNKMRIGGGIFTYDRIDFEVDNYQSHTEIKAPLSN